MRLVLRFLTITLLAVIGSSTLRAQDNPLVGTWKLDVTKSKLIPDPHQKA